MFVTHDQEEALEVADRIVVMNHGKIEQIGTLGEVYDNPATPFIYQLLGNVNLFHSRVHGGFSRIGGLQIEAPEHASTEDAPALAYVRPHDIVLHREADGSAFSARIQDIHAVGPVVRLELQREDDIELIEAEMSRERFRELGLSEGEQVFVSPRNLRVFLHEAV